MQVKEPESLTDASGN